VTAILVIVFLMQLIAQMGVVKANPFMFGPHMGVIYQETWQQKTYQTSDVPIEIQIDTPRDYSRIVKIYYILDLNFSLKDNPQHALSMSNPQSSTYSGVESIEYFGTGTLRNLSNGTHTIDAYAVDAQGKTIGSGTRNFLVNATSSSNNEQRFAVSNLTIALAISTIAILIGASLAVLAYKRRKKVSYSHD
jgi:hypothetical protein